MTTFEALTSETFTVEMTEIAVQSAISPKVVSLYTRFDPSQRQYLMQMMMNSLTVPYHDIEYPADWYQAFKQRWFPRWALKRTPVRMTKVHLARFCPHVAVPDNRTHTDWLKATKG